MRAGLSVLDITPMLGIGISGYYVPRFAQKILDPLEVRALAVEQDDKTAVLISVDNCGVADDRQTYESCCRAAAQKAGVPVESIYISATHTHTSPFWEKTDPDEMVKPYTQWLEMRIADAAALAVADLKPARFGYGSGTAARVAFVRRFRMKDGSIRTNPGVNNPDIKCPIGEVDEQVNVLRFDRTDADSIVLVNFGNHPDVVGGSVISADWPGFLRRRVEKALDDVKCIFFNGAQGDVNHVNVHPVGGDMNDLENDFDDVARGYGHARHIGNVIAGAVLQVYDKVEYLDDTCVNAVQRYIEVESNMPSEQELPAARLYNELHEAGRDEEIPYKGMELTTVVAEAARMIRLEHGPAGFDICLSAVRIGPVALIGLPGEPFTGIGTALKKAEGWKAVLPCCITNGYEGYFPMAEAYDEGGYEARSSVYRRGVAEKIIEEGLDLLRELRGEVTQE